MRSTRRALCALVVSAVLIGAVLASGCAPKADDSKSLETSVWQADQIRGASGLEPAVSRNVTAEFSGGRVTGNGGVNQYGGTYGTEPGNKITISQVTSTLMAGPQDVMDQEQSYFAALQEAATFEVTADALSLKGGDGNVLVSYKPLEETPLTETEWECVSYNNGRGALVSLITTSTITAVFGQDERLAGNAGVNTYSTTYSAGNGEIKISDAIVTTRMAGPPELMTQETEYLAALPRATVYRIQGTTLELRDAEDAAIAMYTAK